MSVVATMVVKISASVDDLVKGMDKTMRDVAMASDKIAALGKTLTLSVTLPAAAAAIGFSKMAADADTWGDRMNRVYGAQADAMNAYIADLKKTVPASTMELQKLAVEVENMGLGMGLGSAKAFEMSKGLLKLAGDAAAFAHVPIGEAMQALERGLAGRTRGLYQFGIVVKEAQIKQEAFRMGILKQGNELGPAETALATYSLMMKSAARITGEAGRVAGEEGTQFERLKSNFIDMAVKLGTHVLPTLIKFVDALNHLMDAIDRAPPGLVSFGVALVAIAAAAGPLLTLISTIGKVIVAVRSLVALAAAAEGVGAFLVALSAPEIVAGLALVAAAIAGVTYAWKALHHETATPAKVAAGGGATGPGGIIPPNALGGIDLKTPFQHLEERAKAVGEAFKFARQEGLPLNAFFRDAVSLNDRLWRVIRQQGSEFTENGQKARALAHALSEVLDLRKLSGMGLVALQPAKSFGLDADTLVPAMQKAGGIFGTMFDQAAAHGRGLVEVVGRIRLLNSQALQVVRDQAGAYTEAGVAAQELADRTQGYLDAIAIATRQPGAVDAIRARGATGAGTRAATENAAAQFAYGSSMAMRAFALTLPHIFDASAEAKVGHGEQANTYNDSLALREAMIKLPPIFDAVREASIAMKEQFLRTSQSIAVAWQNTKRQFTNWGDMKTTVAQNLKQTGLGIAAMFTPAGLAANALGGAMQGIQPALNALLMPLTILGEIVGRSLIPIMRALFPIFRMVAIAATYIGQVFFTIAGGIAKAVGALIHGLGTLISKIPFMGGLGKRIQGAGEELTNLGNGFADAAHQLALGRAELQKMNFDDALRLATNGLNNFTEALSNAPSGFKIQQFRYEAAAGAPYGVGQLPPLTAASGNMIFTGDVHLHGVQNPTQLYTQLGQVGQTQARRGGTSGLTLAVSGVGGF